MSIIASVVLSDTTREFDKEYYYRIPEGMINKVAPGIRAIVPFGKGNRLKEAYVLNVLDIQEKGDLKEIAKIVDEFPVLNCNLLKLSTWMKNRYICTYSDVIKTMLPPGIGIKNSRIVKVIRNEAQLKPNEKKVIDLLVDFGGECEYDELQEKLAFKTMAKTVKSLEQAGIVSIVEEFSSRAREKTVRVAYLIRPKEEVLEEIESNRIKKIQQIRVMEMLLDNEYIAASDIVRFSGVSAGVLNTLKKNGYIDFKEIEVQRDPYRHMGISRTESLPPTQEQQKVLKSVKLELDKNEFKEALLHGVTGSGKTEVYLQLIHHCMQQGRQSIVLVPEISLTPQMVERFKGRFGKEVAVLHSRLSLGERYDQWRLIRDGKIKVVVGARSAIFAPFEKLGLVIIDEEHENSYKSELTPKYSAREIARERCKYDGAVLLYGSATPSIETYYQALEGKMLLLEMQERANKMMLPEVKIVDMREELEDGNRSVFSRKLAFEIEQNIKNNQQTMLFLNRRGYSSFVLCRKCGYTVKCMNCNVSMTYHAYEDRMICHYCGFTIKSMELCPKCKSNYIRHFGTGTQKIEEEVRKQFPESTVLRMDLDTTSYKNSHEEILRTFKEKNVNILVGTQMIAKGHDFPNVTLVGVLAADSLLNTGDYRASERTFQLITQVAGRAGRGEIPGRVVIQTYNTDDFSIQTAQKHDYVSFYNQEVKIREKLHYPPFTNIAVLILSGLYDRTVFERSKLIKEQLENYMKDFEPEAEVLGPARAPLSKIKNKYRWRIIVKSSDMDKLIEILSKVSDGFNKTKGRINVDLSIDINPVNML